ncbi:MAG: hypothetical protein QG596_248, partial [Actinomycetota bacterium]|nr:hypothetical protein [Actinomycetota bacterium]
QWHAYVTTAVRVPASEIPGATRWSPPGAGSIRTSRRSASSRAVPRSASSSARAASRQTKLLKPPSPGGAKNHQASAGGHAVVPGGHSPDAARAAFSRAATEFPGNAHPTPRLLPPIAGSSLLKSESDHPFVDVLIGRVEHGGRVGPRPTCRCNEGGIPRTGPLDPVTGRRFDL